MKHIFYLLLLVVSINCFAQEGKQLIEHYDPELILLFYIEGNFTNSGYREIMAFYAHRQVKSVIYKLYCFIMDAQDDASEKIYPLPFYITGPFNAVFNINNMPMEALGKSIVWMDYSIGRVGDFNGNGRDELYLYGLSGAAFLPSFFEYDSNLFEFKNIFEYEMDYSILHVIKFNATKKQIMFRWAAESETSTYQWDETAQKYVEAEWEEVEEEPVQPSVEEPVIIIEAEQSPITIRAAEQPLVPIKRGKNKIHIYFVILVVSIVLVLVITIVRMVWGKRKP
jgi:hypothetical protein